MWGPGSFDKHLTQDIQDGTVGLLAQLCTQESLNLLMPCRQARPPIQQIIPESHRQQGHRQASLRPGLQGPRTGGRDGHITDTHLRPRAGQVPQDLREARKGPHCPILGAGKRQGRPHRPNRGGTPSTPIRVSRGRLLALPSPHLEPTPASSTPQGHPVSPGGCGQKPCPWELVCPSSCSLSLGTCVQMSRADLVMWWRVRLVCRL